MLLSLFNMVYTVQAEQTLSAPAITCATQSAFYNVKLLDTLSEEIPGAVLLVKSPMCHFKQGLGLSDIDKKIPMESTTIVPVGSGGKMLIGLLSAILATEGKIDIDMPLSKFIDDETMSRIPNGKLITFRQALNHTAGLYNYVDNQHFFYDSFADPLTEKDNRYALSYAYDKPATSLPGERFNYSNTGYLLAGIALDKALGAHHAGMLRSRVITPLNLKNTFYNGVETNTSIISPGYLFIDENSPLGMAGTRLETQDVYSNMALADAPIASNVTDLSIILRGIVKTSDISTPSVKNLLWGKKSLIKIEDGNYFDSSQVYYGLGIFLERLPSLTLYHHGGAELGYFVQNVYIPKLDVSVAAIFNCGAVASCDEPAMSLVYDVLSFILARELSE